MRGGVAEIDHPDVLEAAADPPAGAAQVRLVHALQDRLIANCLVPAVNLTLQDVVVDQALGLLPQQERVCIVNLQEPLAAQAS